MTIVKRRHFGAEARPRTNEFVLVTRDDGDTLRFEFDYDDGHVYVYTGVWPRSWPAGIGCKTQLPVRAIPMSGWRTARPAC